MKYKGFVLSLVGRMGTQYNSEVKLKHFSPLGMMESKKDGFLG